MSGSAVPTVTVEQFLEMFPAFGADTSKYPQPIILSYLLLATNSLNPNRWCQMLNMGICLYTAHFLTLDAQDMADAEFGKVMGSRGGQVSSKSLGGASVNYDTSGTIEKDGGHWNLTTFGKRYLRFARMAGAGPVQVSGGSWPGRPVGVLTGNMSGQ